MIKVYCDKCEKEIPPIVIDYKMNLVDNIINTLGVHTKKERLSYCLCEKCRKELIKFMKEKDENL